MGIKIGDIDVANEIIELNFQVRRLQMILDHFISKGQINKDVLKMEDIKNIESQVIEALKDKYPNMGIQKRG